MTDLDLIREEFRQLFDFTQYLVDFEKENI